MDAKLLARLRPADDSADALSTSVGRIDEERDATTAKLTALRMQRTAALVTGTAKQVLDLEEQAREAEITLEQLDLMDGDLRPKLRAGRALERQAAFKSEAVETNATAVKAVAWYRDEYPRLAREIVAGLELCRAAENGANGLQHRYGVARASDPDLAALPDPLGPFPPMPRAIVGHLAVPPSQAVQLPPAQGELEPIWWPQLLRGRPHPSGR